MQKTPFAIAACLLLAGCAANFRAPTVATAPADFRSMASPGAEVDAEAARALISLYRRDNGRAGVVLDPGLMAEARRQAEAMAAADKLSHDLRGSLTQRLDRDGYAQSAAVENVSAGYDNFASAFAGWRKSPPHDANLLASGMKRMGIAAAYNPKSRYKVFWALDMAN